IAASVFRMKVQPVTVTVESLTPALSPGFLRPCSNVVSTNVAFNVPKRARPVALALTSEPVISSSSDPGLFDTSWIPSPRFRDPTQRLTVRRSVPSPTVRPSIPAPYAAMGPIAVSACERETIQRQVDRRGGAGGDQDDRRLFRAPVQRRHVDGRIAHG